MTPVELDEVDLGLVHALHIDGRAPFRRIASVLGVSTQTVTRRYRRLREEAGLRVVGVTDPHRSRRAHWLARLTATPGAATDLAHGLARRHDTAWVKLASGGTEIIAVIDTPAGGDDHSLLLRDLPRATGVTSVSAHYLLHTYRGGRSAWQAHISALTLDQERALLGCEEVAGNGVPIDPDEDLDPDPAVRAVPEPDQVGGALADTETAVMLAVLLREGRSGFGEIAAATGWNAATASRRLAALRRSGTLFFDVEIDPPVMGGDVEAMLWMAVGPADTAAVAHELATHPELAFVAATTGPTNLVALALCPSLEKLHEYLNGRLSALGAINRLETAPIQRAVKALGPPALPARGPVRGPGGSPAPRGGART